MWLSHKAICPLPNVVRTGKKALTITPLVSIVGAPHESTFICVTVSAACQSIRERVNSERFFFFFLGGGQKISHTEDQ